MPVQYTSITDEHVAVRKVAGIFDISHMGEVHVTGKGAVAFLNKVLTNDATRLKPGEGQYTLMCNERGGVVDDLYLYCLAPEDYLLIVNAGRIADDIAWLHKQAGVTGRSETSSTFREEFSLQNISDDMAAVAVQGPRVTEFIDQCFSGGLNGGAAVGRPSELKKNQIARTGKDVWISRTGYTGEDGFEIVAPAGLIEPIWNRILEIGKAHGLKPAGLGARDTLRTEVCYPLYGHELDEQTTPIEAGVGFFVALEKGDFIGRTVLAEQKAQGPAKKLVAFRMAEKSAPPRPHYPIFAPGADGKRLGEIVSGTQSPSLGVGIGLGYVPQEFGKAQTPLEIEVRGRRFGAVVVPKPFYRKPN
jgi:aminomethyltransferase